MRNVARADAEFQDLVRKHDDALQGGLMTFGFDVLDGLNDEGRCDLVDLLVAEGLDDVMLQSPTFGGVAHDAAALEIAPKKERVAKRVAARRLLADVLAHFAHFLFGFTIGNIREVSETNIRNPTVEALTENPTF